jgi:hypothetical protein
MAEDPKIMNNFPDTYREMCETRRGMTSWNQNFDRCPKDLFNF